MTANVHTIGRTQTLDTAHRFMREYRVRHLPVLDDGQLVGVLSERDLLFLETFRDVNPHVATVEEAMTPVPYTVEPAATVAEVCEVMAAHRYGTVIVVDRGKPIGIFTSIDALRLLGSVLRGSSRADASRSGEAARV